MRNRQVQASAHAFSRIADVKMERSKFNRSSNYKTTFDAGKLIPVFRTFALPGDTHSLRVHAFARLATPIKPIMDNLYLDFHFFAVPIRLIWDNFQKFMGEQANPDDPTDYLIPQFTAHIPQIGTISDYLGVPTTPQVTTAFSYNSWYHRAYHLIWNEWYRDQNQQDSVVVDKDDGPDTIADYAIQRRGKRHDYFTSALPWPQKGDAVQLPLGTTAPVTSGGGGIPLFADGAGGYGPLNQAGGAGPVAARFGQFSVPNFTAANMSWFDPALVADLSDATAATINELRQAFQVQRLLERDARGGTRYTELVRQHFKVVSPDARLQRPEYLGGGTVNVNISPIAQNSSTDAETPQGNLAGIGTAQTTGQIGFTKSFTEHSLILGIVSARADLTYQQGLDREFSWQTKLDLFWPTLAHLGEQVVNRKEIYCTGAPANDDEPFGYQERYAELRYKPSLVTGLFRSYVPADLGFWHLAQEFVGAPVLGPTFIAEDPPIDRVIAVDTEPHFLFDAAFELHSARPMPVFGTPGFIDHF